MSNRLSLRVAGLCASLFLAGALLGGMQPASAVAVSGGALTPGRYVGPVNMSADKFFSINMREGSTAQDAAIVARYFRSFGMRVTISPDNQILFVDGTYGQAAAAAHTGYARVEFRGQQFTTITGAESYPAAVSSRILATGVNDGPAMRPQFTYLTPHAGYSPTNISTYYDIAPIYTAGFKGTLRTVAIAACGYVLPTDISKFESFFAIPTNTPTYIHVGTPISTTNSDEPVLDVERVIGTANAAKVYVYLAPDDCSLAHFDAMLAKIATDTSTYHFDSVSISYGLSEDVYSFFGLSSHITAENTDFASMISKGATVFCASGDAGAWGDIYEGTLSVLFPASDNLVVSVGGTSASSHGTALPTTRLVEEAWASDGSSGGGVSIYFLIPSWQSAVPGVASTSHRNVPDVSLDADPFTGYIVWFTPPGSTQGEFDFGGTSAGTPTWAALLPLVDQKRKALAKLKLTSVASKLYAAHATAGTYVDITAGSNGFYVAKAGYDNVTGLGVPDAYHLWTYLIGLP